MNGLEFGIFPHGLELHDTVPGRLNERYWAPKDLSIIELKKYKSNVIKLPFSWERVIHDLDVKSLYPPYMYIIDKAIKTITDTNQYCILQMFSFGRYNSHPKTSIFSDPIGGDIITIQNFVDTWVLLANRYKDNPLVMFNIMNEGPTESIQMQELYVSGLVDAITAIRNITQQHIFVSGVNGTFSSNWVDVNGELMMPIVRKKFRNVAFDIHQHFEIDLENRAGGCTTNDMDALFGKTTDWLKANGQVALLGETMVLPRCIPVLDSALNYLDATGAWLGFTYYAAGPHWPEYIVANPSIYVETIYKITGPQLDMLIKYEGTGIPLVISAATTNRGPALTLFALSLLFLL